MEKKVKYELKIRRVHDRRHLLGKPMRRVVMAETKEGAISTFSRNNPVFLQIDTVKRLK